MTRKDNIVLHKNLIDFGLSEKEAAAYIALMELELATATQVARKAGLNRSSTYVVLNSLASKGLVSISEDKKIQHFVATPPDMLLREAEDRAKRAEDIKQRINQIVPELKALHKDTAQKPKIRVFEGKQGLINSFEDTLNNREKIMRAFSFTERLFNILPEYFPDYVERRLKKGIKMHGIHPDDKVARHLLENYPGPDKPILIPFKKYQSKADIAIYDNKIGYISTEKEIFSILIESKEMADIMKNIFDMAYEEAKRIRIKPTKRRHN